MSSRVWTGTGSRRLTRQIEVGRQGHEHAMGRASAARHAKDYKQERMELARAGGHLPEHPAAGDRANAGRKDYDAWADLERTLKQMVNADGSKPDYVIKERGEQLHLDLSGNAQLSDLSALRNMPVTHLDISGCAAVSDLSPLAGMPLQELHADGTRIKDLSPLGQAPLRILSARDTGVSSLDGLGATPFLECSLYGPSGATVRWILPPKPGREWSNSHGMRFDPLRQRRRLARLPLGNPPGRFPGLCPGVEINSVKWDDYAHEQWKLGKLRGIHVGESSV